LVIGVTFVLIQVATVSAWQYWLEYESGTDVSLHPYDGDAIGLSTTATFLTINLLVFLLIRMRQVRVSEYLALNWDEGTNKKTAGWLLVLITLIITFAGLNYLLERPTPDFMIIAMNSAELLPILIFALVIGAPVTEEVVFRGFLYQGLAESRLGPAGAVIISSLIFTMIHVQYESLELGYILILGLVLGTARWHCQSLYVPILLHSGANLIATLDVWWFSSNTAV